MIWSRARLKFNTRTQCVPKLYINELKREKLMLTSTIDFVTNFPLKTKRISFASTQWITNDFLTRYVKFTVHKLLEPGANRLNNNNFISYYSTTCLRFKICLFWYSQFQTFLHGFNYYLLWRLKLNMK